MGSLSTGSTGDRRDLRRRVTVPLNFEAGGHRGRGRATAPPRETWAIPTRGSRLPGIPQDTLACSGKVYLDFRKYGT